MAGLMAAVKPEWAVAGVDGGGEAGMGSGRNGQWRR